MPLNNPTPPDPARVAQVLLQARQGGQPADAALLAPMLHSADDAYRVQHLVLEQLQAASAVPPFWKSGGPGRSAVLTHAPLLTGGVWRSPVDASAQLFQMRLIEAEIALRLREAVTPARACDLSHADAVALVDAMAVSIEIVDSRWQQGLDAPPLAKLADLQSHGALVLGPWSEWRPRDWSRQACTVRIGARAPTVFTGTHSLCDPAWLLPDWLRHATRSGATVPAGTAVTTGTWCGMLPAAAGDQVHVAFDGIGEAAVQL